MASSSESSTSINTSSSVEHGRRKRTGERLESYPPFKLSKQETPIVNDSIEFDSEGFEIYQDPEVDTPTTVEIIKCVGPE